jgi:hypothetical protein
MKTKILLEKLFDNTYLKEVNPFLSTSRGVQKKNRGLPEEVERGKNAK